jgi:MFS family permease
MSRPAAQSDRVEPAGDQLQADLRMVTLAWAFGSIWLWTISGTTLVQFARSLGTPDWGFGILATLPFLGTLMQLPGSYVLERYGHRKLLFIVVASLSRLLWSVAAGIPWLLPGREDLWWPVMALCIGVSWALAQASGPAWMSWMGDLIPRRVRGRYFALRNNVGQSIGLIATLAVGYALDVTERGEDMHLMLRVTSAILAIAGLLGTLDILCFKWVSDREPPPRQPAVDVVAMFAAPLRDANFRRYLAFNFVFVFGTGYVGQYAWLFIRDVAECSNWTSNLLLIAVPLVLRLMVYGAWGRLTDRLGKKPVILISGFFTVFGAVGWIFITPERFWVGYLVVMVVSLAWPGFEVANFNFILDLAGTRRRHTKAGSAVVAGGGSSFVAVNSVVIAVAGSLSGLFGAAVAAKLGSEWVWALPAMGIVLTYHGVLFAVSTVLRAAAMMIAMGLQEEHATRTRDAIRIMTTGFYSNMTRVVTTPVRVAGSVVKMTYRVGGGPGQRPTRDKNSV